MELGAHSDGRTLTYEEEAGVFKLGGAPIDADQVRSLADAEQLSWTSPEIELWFYKSFPPAQKKNGAIFAIVIALMLFGFLFVCAILSAIAIPSFMSARTNAQTKACFANERTIEGAAQVYLAENGALPDSVDALAPTILQPIPECPAGGDYSWDSTAGTVSCSEHGHHQD